MFRSMKTRTALAAAALVGAAALVAGCSSSPTSPSTAPAGTGDAALDELIAAAQAEGEVTLYSSLDERIVQQIQTAFQDEYGVQLSYLRATAAEISQRFSAEADADAKVADVIVTLNDGFLADGIEQGRIQPLEDADIPGYPGEWLPEEAQMDGLAVVQLTQLGMGFNTDNAPEIETWEDLLDPALTGKVAISSPDSAVHLGLFYVLSEEYGMEFLEALGAQVERVYTSGSQVVEALSSGEAWAAPGTVATGLEIAKGQGAPLGWAIPENTLLSPNVMGLVADSPHPAGARLLSHFLTSEEGLALLNDSPGQVAPSTQAFEAGWLLGAELSADAAEKKAEIVEALGI